MNRQRLEHLVRYYRRIIDDMQGRTFYVEDEDGVLRRWHPPQRHIMDRSEDDTD